MKRVEITTSSNKDVLGVGASATEQVTNTNRGRLFGFLATSKSGKTVTTKLDFYSGGKTSGKLSGGTTTSTNK